jgi:hypothetical protein
MELDDDTCWIVVGDDLFGSEAVDDGLAAAGEVVDIEAPRGAACYYDFVLGAAIGL